MSTRVIGSSREQRTLNGIFKLETMAVNVTCFPIRITNLNCKVRFQIPWRMFTAVF